MAVPGSLTPASQRRSPPRSSGTCAVDEGGDALGLEAGHDEGVVDGGVVVAEAGEAERSAEFAEGFGADRHGAEGDLIGNGGRG